MFEDEFGAIVYIFINTIKYLKENKGGPYEQLHQGAKSIIGTTYGDVFYTRVPVKDLKDAIVSSIKGEG
jgi:hypothetical protein